MLPLPMEYVSSVCEIKTLENELVATGTIAKITPESIEISDKTGLMPMAAFGTTVKINVFSAKEGFRVLAGRVYTSSLRFISIVDITSLLDYERRHFFRVEINTTAQLTMGIQAEEKRRAQNGEEPLEVFSVNLRNLSLGGCLFGSERDIEPGTHVSIRMRFGRTPTIFDAVIRRPEDKKGDMNFYGCEFINVDEKESNSLCAFIFQRQRELIHSRKNQ